jgi:hypothetical protein
VDSLVAVTALFIRHGLAAWAVQHKPVVAERLILAVLEVVVQASLIVFLRVLLLPVVALVEHKKHKEVGPQVELLHQKMVQMLRKIL